MIYDTLNNLPNYLGLVSGLDAVIEFCLDHSRSPGKSDAHHHPESAQLFAGPRRTHRKLSFSGRAPHLHPAGEASPAVFCILGSIFIAMPPAV